MSLVLPESTLGLRHPDFESDEYWADYNRQIPLVDLGFHCDGSCYRAMRATVCGDLPHLARLCADAAAWIDLPQQWVEIPADLHPIQPTVNSLVVDYYRDGGIPHQDDVSQFPVFAIILGQTYLWNGTHRVVSTMMAGLRSTQARLVDFDQLAS